MIKGMLGKIDKIYVSLRNIDTVAIKNPKSYILANFGNVNEILKLAIKYLNEGNLDTCLKHLSKIDVQLLLENNCHLAEYWSLCFDVYYYKSTYHIHFKDYFENKHYDFKWHLIKKSINDGLIRGRYQITQALAKVEIYENEAFDFFKFVFNNIQDINEIYNIFTAKTKLIKNAILYGYSNGFLNFDDLLAMAKANNEFAAALLFLIQKKQVIKTISESKLLNVAFELGNAVANVRFECGLICLQLGNLEKASILLSNVPKDSPNHARAMKEYGDILYTNSNNPALSVTYYRKAYEAGDSDAKLLLTASESKEKGETPSIIELYDDAAESQANHNSNSIISDKLISVDCTKSQSSQKIPLSYAISYDAFKNAHHAYLSERGFFSSQSAATQKVISKASRPYITNQKRFHILKKYSEKKSNFGRTFWSSIVCHFSHLFIEYDKSDVASSTSESRAKLTKSLT